MHYKMRIAKIRQEDIVNGPGIRVSLFVQGCTRHCKDCFNKDTWDFSGGTLFNQRIEEQFLSLGEQKRIVGFSILGGEPLDQGKDLLHLVKKIKERFPDKTLWIWTGYQYEELNALQHEIISYADVIVDGPFIQEKKCPSKRFKGSLNQRVIDVPQTLSQKKIILSTFN